MRTSWRRWTFYGGASGVVVMGPLAALIVVVDSVSSDKYEDLGELALVALVAWFVGSWCGAIGGAMAGFITATMLGTRRMRSSPSASQYARTAAFVAALGVTLAVLDPLVEGRGVPVRLYVYLWILPGIAAATAAAIVGRIIWREEHPPPPLMTDLPPPPSNPVPGERLDVGREHG